MSQNKFSCYGNWFSTLSVINVYCREVWCCIVSLYLDAHTCTERHSRTCELLDWVPGVVVDFVTYVKLRLCVLLKCLRQLPSLFNITWSLCDHCWDSPREQYASLIEHMLSVDQSSLCIHHSKVWRMCTYPVTQCWLDTLAVSHWPLEGRLYTWLCICFQLSMVTYPVDTPISILWFIMRCGG